MDLPTYTNIWRIEKRLYKLYDLRLPMPLPIVWIGVFVGVLAPWSILLALVGVPFETPWHVLYLVPPGVVTWLSTRPVIESKRLNELLQSQVRYLSEPRTWCRLAPVEEPVEITLTARVWRTAPPPGRAAATAGATARSRRGTRGKAKHTAPRRRPLEAWHASRAMPSVKPAGRTQAPALVPGEVRPAVAAAAAAVTGTSPAETPAVRTPERPRVTWGSVVTEPATPTVPRPGTATPASRPGTGTPASRPTTGTPSPRTGTGTPASRPGTGTPASRPGTGTPASRPGTGTPASRPGTGTPASRPGTGTPASRPGTGTPALPGTGSPARAGTPPSRPATGTPAPRPTSGTPELGPLTGTPELGPLTGTPQLGPLTGTPEPAPPAAIPAVPDRTALPPAALHRPSSQPPATTPPPAKPVAAPEPAAPAAGQPAQEPIGTEALRRLRRLAASAEAKRTAERAASPEQAQRSIRPPQNPALPGRQPAAPGGEPAVPGGAPAVPGQELAVPGQELAVPEAGTPGQEAAVAPAPGRERLLSAQDQELLAALGTEAAEQHRKGQPPRPASPGRLPEVRTSRSGRPLPGEAAAARGSGASAPR
ncbi:conjugal transfer protein, partial [Sphaerisporangium aureirubrum]